MSLGTRPGISALAYAKEEDHLAIIEWAGWPLGAKFSEKDCI